jgi:hypothetical protein
MTIWDLVSDDDACGVLLLPPPLEQAAASAATADAATAVSMVCLRVRLAADPGSLFINVLPE